jgi:hypothetical protein
MDVACCVESLACPDRSQTPRYAVATAVAVAVAVAVPAAGTAVVAPLLPLLCC